jgi:hypothetical protein
MGVKTREFCYNDSNYELIQFLIANYVVHSHKKSVGKIMQFATLSSSLQDRQCIKKVRKNYPVVHLVLVCGSLLSTEKDVLKTDASYLSVPLQFRLVFKMLEQIKKTIVHFDFGCFSSPDPCEMYSTVVVR